MNKEPSDTVILAWTRLVRAHHAALSSVETALKRAGLPPLAWYDALLEVERAGPVGIRPYELEQQMLLPQYGLSRLLNRIEAAGYLERLPCPDDRRGQVLVITAPGAAIRKQMWPVYRQAIETAVGSRLTDRQARTLTGLLQKLI
jgi:DNA-binding MarR family transcriptional regulator